MSMTCSRRLAALIGVLFATMAYGRGNLKELTVPLKYTPQEGVHQTSTDVTPALLNQSVEIRIEDARKLDDPLKKGLITEFKYDKKRTEICNGI